MDMYLLYVAYLNSQLYWCSLIRFDFAFPVFAVILSVNSLAVTIIEALGMFQIVDDIFYSYTAALKIVQSKYGKLHKGS